MILAAYRDDSYNVVLLIHIVAFLAAFAPAAINPYVNSQLNKVGDESALVRFATNAASYTRRVSLPALVVLFLTGPIMVALSDDVFEMSDGWISAAFVVWFAIGGVVSAVILKNEKAAAAGDVAALDKVARGGQIASVLLLVMLYLMIFKPGA